MICVGERSDVKGIVEVHIQSFPGFFLTFLGPRFLRLLYEEIIEDDDGIVLVAKPEGEVIGFVAGVVRQSGFYRRLLCRRMMAFALAAAHAALRSPMIVPRLLRALRRPAEAQSSAAEACLMSIAVHPAAQGGGIGGALVRAFCWELAQRGVEHVCLTTDRDRNEAANRFYQRLGFRLAREFTTPEGRHMNEYVADTRIGLPTEVSQLAIRPNPASVQVCHVLGGELVADTK